MPLAAARWLGAVAALPAVVALVAVVAPGASASWSASERVPVPTHAALVTVAAGARGDVALGWSAFARTAPAHVGRGRVGVVVPRADGRLRTHLVWTGRARGTPEVATAVDRRGRVTVAWRIDRRVFATYATAGGSWARRRLVGRGIEALRLAAAPNGDVLLAWFAQDAELHGLIRTAWRRAGGPFGGVTTLRRPTAMVGDYSTDDLAVAFDARGAAYLSDTCDGTLRTARPGHRQFEPPLVVQPGRVLGLSVSVADGARGVVSWVNGWCTADAAAGSEPGPAFLRTIDGRRHLGPRVALPSSDDAFGTIAVARPSGARTVSWVESGATRTGVFSVGIDAAGVLGPLTTVQGGLVAHRVTGGGDVVLDRVFPGPPDVFGTNAVVVRPAGGGPDEPSPAPFGGAIAVAMPGRVVALLWQTPSASGTGPWHLSRWRP